jgi:hypothetical protein
MRSTQSCACGSDQLLQRVVQLRTGRHGGSHRNVGHGPGLLAGGDLTDGAWLRPARRTLLATASTDVDQAVRDLAARSDRS